MTQSPWGEERGEGKPRKLFFNKKDHERKVKMYSYHLRNNLMLTAFWTFSFLAAIFVPPSLAGVDIWSYLGLEGETVNVVVIDPTNSKIIYAGSESGVHKSTDGGATWDFLGLIGIKSIVIDPTSPNLVWAAMGAGSYSDGVWKSTDGGATWNVSFWLFHAYALALDKNDTKVIYVGSYDYGIFKTTDGGVNWIPMGLTGTGIRYLVIDPTNSLVVYVGADSGVFKSTNGGIDWENKGLGGIYSVGVDPKNSNTVYAAMGWGSYSDGIWKSTNGGDSWDVAKWIAYTMALAIDRKDPSRVYAGSSYLEEGAYMSPDWGGGWTKMKSETDPLPVLNLSLDPRRTYLAYAGTKELGVFRYFRSISITFVPRADSVPPGGTLVCDWTVTNHLGTTRTLKAWIDGTSGPDTSHSNGWWKENPIFGPRQVTLRPYERRVGVFNLRVPQYAVLGDYVGETKIGDYPEVLDYDRFIFTVVNP